MSIPKPIVDEVLARTDIAELIGRTVTLKRNGKSLVGLCPFHQEKSPSFNVIPHKGFFHCFGCGEGGDAIGWLRKTRGLSFPEAVRELAAAVGITVEERELAPAERARLQVRNDIHGVCEAAERTFHQTLMVAPEGAVARDYLKERGVTLDTARAYRLGYAPEGWSRLADSLHRDRVTPALGVQAGLLKLAEDRSRTYDVFRNRLIFPILDDRDRPIAFGGRVLPGEVIPPGKTKPPKYLNSPESPIYEKSKVLYGLNWARSHIQRTNRVILVEGYFDAVALWQAGFGEAVATCGTALTRAHLDVIKKLTLTVIALFDSDEAGLRAATKSMDLFLSAEMSAYRLDIGEAKDPDEFIQKFGAVAFADRLAAKEELLKMVVRRRREIEGKDPAAVDRVLATILPHVLVLDETRQAALALEIGDALNSRSDHILDRLAQARRVRPEPQPAVPAPSRWVPPIELSHLFWLVIHFPAQVAVALADAEPDHISDRPEVLNALIRLATGESLASVLEAAGPDLARTLRAIAARQGEYREEQALSVATDQLGKLALPHIERELRATTEKWAACTDPVVKSSYVERVRTLTARRIALTSRKPGPARPAGA